MPSTVVAPTTTGSRAARPPKKSNESSTRIGSANKLGTAEVAGDRLAELSAGHGTAADQDVVGPLEVVEHAQRHLLVVGVGGQGRDHERGGAVLGRQAACLRGRGIRGDHGRDALALLEEGDHLGDPVGGAGDTVGHLDEQHDAG